MCVGAAKPGRGRAEGTEVQVGPCSGETRGTNQSCSPPGGGEVEETQLPISIDVETEAQRMGSLKSQNGWWLCT